MENVDIDAVANLIQNLGLWAIFTWLYIQEKKAHQLTREQYRDDLREIANLRSNLNRVQTYVRDTQTFPPPLKCNHHKAFREYLYL